MGLGPLYNFFLLGFFGILVYEW